MLSKWKGQETKEIKRMRGTDHGWREEEGKKLRCQRCDNSQMGRTMAMAPTCSGRIVFLGNQTPVIHFPVNRICFLKCFNVVPQIISPLKRESRSKKCDNYTLFSKLKIEKLVQIPTAHGVGRPVTTALQMWLGLALPDVVGCSKVPNVHTL